MTAASSRVQAFKEAKHKAFVVGYTGEVGKEIVKELASADVFERVVLFGRREIELPQAPGYDKMEQKVVDFDKLEEYKDAFKGLDFGYCALGTTRGKAGVQGFIKVDHDYVVNTAKVAKEAGCQHFLLVSSHGTNKNSPFLYPKTKGITEEDLKALDFNKLSIFRPAMLLCPSGRGESRLMERAALAALSPIAFMFPTFITIPTPKVARAMLNAAILSQVPPKIETLENADVHRLGGMPLGGEA